MIFRIIVYSAIFSIIGITSGTIEAAPLISPRAAVPQKQAPPANQAVPSDRKNFTINTAAGVYFQAGIGVTTTGDLIVDLAIPTAPAQKTPPVAVYLRNESTGQVSASTTITSPTGRVSYQVKQADIASGAAVYSVLIGASVPLNATANVMFPTTDGTRLNQYLNRLAPQQKQVLTNVLNMPAASAPKRPVAVTSTSLRGTINDGIIDGPIPFSTPQLPSRQSARPLNRVPADISRKLVSAAPSIPFRPFQLDEVFDLKTGKPYFPINTQPAARPRKGAINYAIRNPAEGAELQRRGIAGTIGRGGSYALKPHNGIYDLSSELVVPRPDGTSLTVPVTAFLKELNAMEKGLNTHGTTMRDPLTGRISTITGEATIARAEVNRDLVRRQRLAIDKSVIKGLPHRLWTPADIATRHQKAAAKVSPVKQGARNRLEPTTPVATIKKAVPAATGVNLGAKVASIPAMVNPNVAKSTLCELANVTQQEGGNPDEDVTLMVKLFDPAVCVVSFEDSTGRSIEQPAQQLDQFQVKTRVPTALAKGAGRVMLKEKGKPFGFGLSVPFYVGGVCSIDSVYPPVGMAGTAITLKVGRFRGCDINFADSLNFQSQVVPNRYENPNEVTLEVPTFTLGKGKIEARLKPVQGRQQPTASSTNFKILLAAADPGGNAPPPDYFARGIKPFERIYRTPSLLYGDPNNIAVDVMAQFSVSSKGATPKNGDAAEYDNLVWFKGDGQVRGMLFGSDPYEIIGAHAKASVPTANSEDSKLRANFELTAGGLVVYRWQKSKNQETGQSETTDPQDCEEVREDGTCIKDGFNATVQFKYSKDFKLLNVDQKAETSFVVGGVPFVARIGFHGEAGTKVKFAISPLQVIGQATPYVKTSMYAECAVGFLFLKAGLGVDMILANLELDGAGQVYLDFGQMALVTELYLHYTYDLLNGTLYAFVEGPGDFRYKHDIFNINDLLNQNGVDVSFLKGSGYLIPPQMIAYPLLSDI